MLVLTILPAAIHDMPALYRICLQTAMNGNDASEYFTDPDLVGHVFAGPYLVGDGAFGFVAVDDDGVAGYILGAADTVRFDDWAERRWWPALRKRYPDRPADDTPPAEGAPEPADRLVAQIHRPAAAEADIVCDYPAHLHIDLLPRAQGTGAGRRLIDAFVDELAGRGVPGVHLGVSTANRHAVGFYRHLGFETLRERPDSLLLGLPVGDVGAGR